MLVGRDRILTTFAVHRGCREAVVRERQRVVREPRARREVLIDDLREAMKLGAVRRDRLRIRLAAPERLLDEVLEVAAAACRLEVSRYPVQPAMDFRAPLWRGRPSLAVLDL